MAQALVQTEVSLKHKQLLNFHWKLKTLCIKAQALCFTFLIAALDFHF